MALRRRANETRSRLDGRRTLEEARRFARCSAFAERGEFSAAQCRGFLTGNVRRAEEYPEGDFRRGDPRYQGENFDANVRAASAVRELARRKGATAGQIALAWLLHKGPDIVPIPGTKRRAYLEENVAAADVRLTRDELATLDVALAADKVAGARYGEMQMAQIDR